MTGPAGRPRAHGPHNPATTTPARPLGSVRRTTSIDLVRPGGPSGDLVVAGRVRDLGTDALGSTTVLADDRLDARVGHDGRLAAIATRPTVTGIEHLLGAIVGPGFRSRVDEVLGGADHVGSGAEPPVKERPSEARPTRAVGGVGGREATRQARRLMRRSRTALRDDGPTSSLRSSPLYLLLDDLPVTVLISGYGDMARHSSIPFDATIAARMVDLCAGWQAGATMMDEVDATGRLPTPFGPPAPTLEGGDDPRAWHPLADLPPGAMRRRRRLDVSAGEPLVIGAMFRDSHVDDGGIETVLHEYEIDATVDARTGRVTSVSTVPRVLPWPECPAAAASAERVVGVRVDELRPFVRNHLTGVSTCTHLNDALRSLADVAALARHLPG